MALGHKDGRRPARRAFQPTLDGRLETRVLMSRMAEIRSQTAAGGQAVVITDLSGQQFFASVIGGGSIQATPAPGGRVNLIVEGSTVNTLLEINQIIPMHSPTKGAHTFNPTLSNGTGILNVASITVGSGLINSIEGYRDTILSGPIVIAGNKPVNRIALQSIRPGGSISVGGELDTLDILTNADFSMSSGLYVAQDLNWFEVGGNLTFENGSNMVVGRDLGLQLQAAKGSGNAGQGLYVNGDFTIAPGSAVAVGRNIPFGVLINGNFSGYSNFTVGGQSLGNFFAARGGVNFLIMGTITP